MSAETAHLKDISSIFFVPPVGLMLRIVFSCIEEMALLQIKRQM